MLTVAIEQRPGTTRQVMQC